MRQQPKEHQTGLPDVAAAAAESVTGKASYLEGQVWITFTKGKGRIIH